MAFVPTDAQGRHVPQALAVLLLYLHDLGVRKVEIAYRLGYFGVEDRVTPVPGIRVGGLSR
jgi:hypothetical protein